MTAFRRQLRLHQSRWREAGPPNRVATDRPAPGEPSRPVGSRLPLDYARETGANFLTAGALDAARARTSVVEPHQSFDHQRLWADLLWSPAMAFNLFGDLADDLGLADRAVHAWWPDAPGTVRDVRFAHSPGRLDPAYLGSLVASMSRSCSTSATAHRGSSAVDTKYHESTSRRPPKPSNGCRATARSPTGRASSCRARSTRSTGADLIRVWLEHLLVLSMLQHPSGAWTLGPARRRPPRRQHRLRRGLLPLPRAARRPVDVRRHDGRRAPRRRCPAATDGLSASRAIHPVTSRPRSLGPGKLAPGVRPPRVLPGKPGRRVRLVARVGLALDARPEAARRAPRPGSADRSSRSARRPSESRTDPPRADEDVLRARRAMDEVPGPQRPLLAFDEQRHSPRRTRKSSCCDSRW